jgi:hypothetical protein
MANEDNRAVQPACAVVVGKILDQPAVADAAQVLGP